MTKDVSQNSASKNIKQFHEEESNQVLTVEEILDEEKDDKGEPLREEQFEKIQHKV